MTDFMCNDLPWLLFEESPGVAISEDFPGLFWKFTVTGSDYIWLKGRGKRKVEFLTVTTPEGLVVHAFRRADLGEPSTMSICQLGE